MFAELIIF